MPSAAEYFKFLTALIALLNPIGAVPIFINLTEQQTDVQRRRTARIAAITVAAVLVVSAFTGNLLLGFFGISIGAFRVAGGLLILLMALAMLQAKPSPVRHTAEELQDSAQRENIAVVPLGIPLLAGPGAISTVILYASHGRGVLEDVLLTAAILFTAVLVWLCLRLAPYLARFLGRTGINVFTRIMGLIMASIGVEFMATGLATLFPHLLGS
jgi:multiple antibiotic resistance protein